MRGTKAARVDHIHGLHPRTALQPGLVFRYAQPQAETLAVELQRAFFAFHRFFLKNKKNFAPYCDLFL